MEIKTKYNIGDEVWIKFCNTPLKMKIHRILTISEGGIVRILYQKVLDVSWHDESELFPTKEELLASLK